MYTLSLAPTVTLEDSGELLTAACNLGIPHPPGYPLWCLLAHPFTWIPIGSIAERVHFFDALCGAGACLMVQRIGVRLGGYPWIALMASIQLAITPSLWSQSVIAEVYSLNALLIGISIFAAIGFVDQPTPRNLSFLAGSIGLGATNHHLAPYLSIPLVVWVLVRHPRFCIKPAYWFPSLLWLALGLSIYAYLPIRAAAHPVPNVGNPVTWSAAIDHITRKSYSTGNETIRFADSWTDSAWHAFHAMVGYPEFESMPMILGLLSLPLWIRKRPDYAAVMIAILLLNNVLLPFLINDRLSGGWVFAHRIYGIPANLAMITLLAGSASPPSKRAQSSLRKPSILALALLGVILTAATLAFLASFTAKHGYRRHDRTADQVGRAVLDSLPKNAALIPADDFIYVILYLTQVERYRPDVVIPRQEFGYDPKKGFAGLYSIVPNSPALEKDLASMGKIRFVPQGLVYRIERTNAATPPIDPKTFQELTHPPDVPPRAADYNDVFHRFARGLVCHYWARVGEKRFLEGRFDEADAAFEKAESCLDTSIACLQLEEIYSRNKVRLDKREMLLKSALRWHESFYDPASSRYLFVDPEEVKKRLSQIEASSP
jgi:hypothetical protein